MLSYFPKYRISARTAETLKQNEPARWEAAEDDLRVANKALGKRGFTEDQFQRLVALALLVEKGVFSWSVRPAEFTVQIPAQSEPALATVAEPMEDIDDGLE